MRTQPHTHVQIKHPCLPLFICTTSVILSHTRIHTQGLEAALSPDSHAPPDSTNQDKLQPCPHLPPPKPALSYPPLISAASPHPSYLALCDCWAAQGPTVIGLDIIYWPLGNVAFQHLIKIISSHSNGRYGLKGSHCNHLDTRRGSCSLSLRSVLLLPLVSVVLFLPRMINT